MKQIIRNSLAIAGLMTALAGAAANAAHLPPSIHNFGQAAVDGSFERVIRITHDTASVTVYRMETVKFVDEQSGNSFVWRFSTPPHTEDFPLGQIAPAGFLGRHAVTTYVWDIPTPGTLLILSSF